MATTSSAVLRDGTVGMLVTACKLFIFAYAIVSNVFNLSQRRVPVDMFLLRKIPVASCRRWCR